MQDFKGLEVEKSRANNFAKRFFSEIIKELDECLNAENLVSGFKACGIYPLDPTKVLEKLPDGSLPSDINNAVSGVVLAQLKDMRSPREAKKVQKRKKVDVEPGKSVSSCFSQ